MKSSRLVVTALVIAGLGASGACAQVDAFAENRRLGRGINLPGVFDRRGGLVPEPPMKAEYFQKIKEAGFSNVRLVIRWSSYAQQEPPFRIDPDFLRKVDWAVKQCLTNGLAVVLDFHYYPLISFTGTETSREDPEKNRMRFLALWQQVSEHYKEAPPEVMFGLLNEPSRANLGVEGWNQLVAETIPLMRRTNPARTVLVQTANGGGFGTIEGLRIPEGESKVIVEVHYYDPGRFTHQQASWSSNRIYKDVAWPESEEQQKKVTEDFAKVAAWAKANRRPLYLGEFGAYQAAEMPSRVRWTSHVARTAEQNGMSWAYWGFWRCGFDLFDAKAESWNEPLLKALLPGGAWRFKPAGGGEFEFDTGVLRGKLRAGGRSQGLSSVVHIPSGATLSRGVGLFTHYRVFSANRRYGPAAYGWLSEATLREDGSVEVRWPAGPQRPFEMWAVYRWSGPATLDLETGVRPQADLPGFEAFLASYFAEQFTNSLVYVQGDKPTFLAAERSYGDWQMFPRDPGAVALVEDGRWNIEPNPVRWAMRPALAQPIGVRRAGQSGMTAVLMAPPQDCFALATPHQTEGHYSLYLSLFGWTIRAGETARARARLVIASSPGEDQILALYRAYLAQ